MRLFLSYLKSKRKIIIIFLLFSVIFITTFALYRLPLMAVIYPICLCFILSVLFLTVDFIKIKKTHKKLNDIKKMTAEMITDLPKSEKIIESDYQDVVRNLIANLSQLRTEDYAKYQNMVEYYTVWAHQIKTPISAMKLTLHNEDTALSRRLTSELLKIEQYVEMVLAFLRLDANGSDYVFKKYRLDDIIRPVIKRFSTEFILRKLKLEYEPIYDTVITDEKWLSLVIEQVLSNALKYTKEGGIRIYMQKPATLVISDSGIGISQSDLPRIFEKGYTGFNGRTDKTASGIGLYLCNRICDNLGIKISASSEDGKGTDISIDFLQHSSIKE